MLLHFHYNKHKKEVSQKFIQFKQKKKEEFCFVTFFDVNVFFDVNIFVGSEGGLRENPNFFFLNVRMFTTKILIISFVCCVILLIHHHKMSSLTLRLESTRQTSYFLKCRFFFNQVTGPIIFFPTKCFQFQKKTFDIYL